MNGDLSNVSICLAPFFFLLAVVLGIAGVINRNKAKKASGWPSVQGKVIDARLEEQKSTDLDDNLSIHYRPVVTYQYEIGGQTYASNRTGVIPMNYDQKTAQKKLDAFPMGSALTVFYNPENPEEALLNPSKTTANIFLIIGIVVLVISCVLTIFIFV